MSDRRLPTVPALDFPSSRWQTLRSDVESFLASPFAAKAKALGWSDLDLFGIDRDRPYARIDCMGLVIVLDGATVIDMTAEVAVLENAAGTRQTFQRRGGNPGRVLIWDLA